MSDYLAKTVMKQYSNSPIMLALLAAFDEWVDPTQFTADFLANVWDISTAVGFGLDIWGRILGQSRNIEIEQTPSDNFGFNAATIDVQNAPIGTGDGTTVVFTVKNAEGVAVSPVAASSAFYLNDWQGNQLLYSTARTNIAFPSTIALATGSWTTYAAGGTVTVTSNATIGPDGVTSFPTVQTATAGAGVYDKFNVVSGATYYDVYDLKPIATVSGACPVRLGTDTVAGYVTFDLETLAFSAIQSGVVGYGYSVLSNGWYRVWVSWTATGTGLASMLNYHGASTSTSQTWATGLVSRSTVMGRSIVTTTAAATVTDYTLSGSTLTLAQAPLVGAALTWTGDYTQTGTNWQPFGQAPFYGGAASGTYAYPLADDYYRQLLLVKAAANIASSDCPSINALMRSMFGSRGRCYVGYDIDKPMHIGYHFEFTPTTVEKSIIESGLFPQPAGVTVVYIYQTIDYSPFGFAGANVGADQEFVTGFNQGPFYQP